MTTELETIAFRMILHRGQEAEYRRRHDGIWPELSQALLTAGVLDYHIFLDPETCHLFAFMTRRRDHGLESLRHSTILQRWWAMMSDIMETHADNSPLELALNPVFHLGAAGCLNRA